HAVDTIALTVSRANTRVMSSAEVNRVRTRSGIADERALVTLLALFNPCAHSGRNPGPIHPGGVLEAVLRARHLAQRYCIVFKLPPALEAVPVIRIAAYVVGP